MSDRVFFIAAFMVAVFMVVLGLAPGLGEDPSGPVSGGGTDYSRIEVSGPQLSRIVAGGDVDIDLMRADGRDVVRIGALADALSEDPLQGPHFVLAPDLEVAFAGRPVRVTVTARAADKYGASEMRLHYWAGSGEGSGWQTFNLTRTLQDYSFVYEPPARNQGTDPGYDYIAIRPVVPEKERALFVSAVTLQPLEPGANSE